MNIPSNLRYTESHEWVSLEGDVATVGISDFAQSELGDVVYVDLPNTGRVLNIGDSFASVESVKTVSEVYSPVAGEVVAVNSALGAQSELINTEPYDGGWLIKVKSSNSSAIDQLMTPDAYKAHIS